MTSATPTPEASPTAAERFVAGTMLAGRFRYVDRLGRGSMDRTTRDSGLCRDMLEPQERLRFMILDSRLPKSDSEL